MGSRQAKVMDASRIVWKTGVTKMVEMSQMNQLRDKKASLDVQWLFLFPTSKLREIAQKGALIQQMSGQVPQTAAENVRCTLITTCPLVLRECCGAETSCLKHSLPSLF